MPLFYFDIYWFSYFSFRLKYWSMNKTKNIVSSQSEKTNHRLSVGGGKSRGNRWPVQRIPASRSELHPAALQKRPHCGQEEDPKASWSQGPQGPQMLRGVEVDKETRRSRRPLIAPRDSDWLQRCRDQPEIMSEGEEGGRNEGSRQSVSSGGETCHWSWWEDLQLLCLCVCLGGGGASTHVHHRLTPANSKYVSTFSERHSVSDAETSPVWL